MMKIRLLIALAAVAVFRAWAEEDYTIPKIDPGRSLIVAPNGDDAGAGTLEKPFQTLARALKDIQPGTVVLLRGGIYSNDNIRIEGVKSIVVASYPAETAVLTASLINVLKSRDVLFDRLSFVRQPKAVTCNNSPYTIFRECSFTDSRLAIAFGGGNAAERGIVDRCTFTRIGEGTNGEAIYTTAPMTIRGCTFRDIGPVISIAAYTSKNDAFSGLRVIGNTFIHGGACITSTGKGSLIQSNVALGSRFLSSAGSEARIEDNIAVYDPRDMAQWPDIPRRDIGFRMYGRNSKLLNNTFIGFEQGGNIYKPEGATNGPAPVEVRGNRFYGFTKYALRIHDPKNLSSTGNFFALTGSNTTVVYLTPTQTNKVALTLAEWQARGFDSNSVVQKAGEPVIPAAIREALQP